MPSDRSTRCPVRSFEARSIARWAVLALALVSPWLVYGAAAPAGPEDRKPAAAENAAALPARHQRFLEDVALLMSEAEREVFLALGEDYQRDHFIRRFWAVRDPFRQTTRNELEDAWEVRALEARELYEDLTSPRARMLLTFGEPSRRDHFTCSQILRPLEVWEYAEGSDRIRGFFTLVFVGISPNGRGPHSQWEPTDGISRLITTARTFGYDDRQLAQLIARECTRADNILAALSQALDLSRLKEKAVLLPQPSDEWVRTFEARSTNVADGAAAFAGDLQLSFPGRHQSRTVVQGVVAVRKDEVEPSQVGDYRSYNLLLDGEILRQGELFDHFRYRFDFPAASVEEMIPLVVQRYLRPGRYELIVKVEDLSSKRVFREQRPLDVPSIQRSSLPRVGASVPGVVPGSSPAASSPAASSPAASSPAASSPAVAVGVAESLDVATAGSGAGAGTFQTRLLEANASIATGDHTIKIMALPDVLSVGQLRVHAQARGDDIARVAFELNGQPVMRKSRPPYSVELNLGDRPRTHTLRAVALDDDGRVLATDEVLINAGPHRFSIRLLEPQNGKRYTQSIRAHAEVEVPEGERLDRVELYLNETLLATLYQPPFEQPILLQGAAELAYVRAVAYLQGGSSAEDVRIINAPDYVDTLKVQFVELYTTVVDRAGEFVDDLSVDEVEVLEEGRPQQVKRFETMRDLPIRAGLVIDTSLSMQTSLRDVKKAAHRFFESVLTERDRAALITFADAPQLVVRFTSSQEVLAGGLSGLVAEGETALYDSIIFSLHYFSGLQGKRAVVILTDGEDSISTYSYEDAIDFARRTGVAIYIVGLDLESKKSEVRMKIQRLARETGGECFFIERVSQLEQVYDSIQEELRSQYLIAYQSSVAGGNEFREVEIRVRRKGLEAKTIRGYFP